jgi:hypothetical protein
MLFLIEYDRSAGRIARMTQFEDAQREQAENARLGIELSLLGNGIRKEVVLLEAASEQALRLTHRRYFQDLSGLARTSATST